MKLKQELWDAIPSLLDGIPMPILITDMEMRLELVNKAAQEIIGNCGDAENTIGQPCSILNTGCCNTEDCAITRLLRGGESESSLCRDGKEYRVSTVPRTGPNGETCGFIQVWQDITRIIETQKKLKETIQQMQATERELSISEERYRVAAANTRDIIIDYDFHSRVMFHTIQATEIYGVPQQLTNAPESLVESGVISPKCAEGFLETFQQMRDGQQKTTCLLLASTAEGTEIWNRINFTAIFDDDRKPVRAIGIIRDITREKEAELRYEREVRYRSLTMQDNDLYYEVDLTTGLFLTGYEKAAEYLEGPSGDYQVLLHALVDHLVSPEDRELVAAKISLEALRESYEHGERKMAFQYRRIMPEDGSIYWVECTCYLFEDEESGNTRVVGYIRDISAAKTLELDLRQRAERDLLTGLYNKITTENLIGQFVTKARLQRSLGAFLLIDLDNFKGVNDTYGHDVGDLVLTETARHLREALEPQDIIGRLGGDEFVVFLTEPGSTETVRTIAIRISELLKLGYPGCGCKVSCSIGISLFPRHGGSFHQLYRSADRALYEAKAKGKDTFSLFHEVQAYAKHR